MSNQDAYRQAKTAKQVAYVLMKLIARNEGRSLDRSTPIERYTPSDRKYILDLYADCLEGTHPTSTALSDAGDLMKRMILSLPERTDPDRSRQPATHSGGCIS